MSSQFHKRVGGHTMPFHCSHVLYVLVPKLSLLRKCWIIISDKVDESIQIIDNRHVIFDITNNENEVHHLITSDYILRRRSSYRPIICLGYLFLLLQFSLYILPKLEFLTFYNPSSVLDFQNLMHMQYYFVPIIKISRRVTQAVKGYHNIVHRFA